MTVHESCPGVQWEGGVPATDAVVADAFRYEDKGIRRIGDVRSAGFLKGSSKPSPVLSRVLRLKICWWWRHEPLNPIIRRDSADHALEGKVWSVVIDVAHLLLSCPKRLRILPTSLARRVLHSSNQIVEAFAPLATDTMPDVTASHLFQ